MDRNFQGVQNGPRQIPKPRTAALKQDGPQTGLCY